MYLIQKGSYEYVLSTSEYILVCIEYILVCTSTYSYVSRYAEDVQLDVLDTDQYILVCTWCVPVHTWMYSTEACLTGFSGAQRVANMWMPDVPSTHRFAVL